MEQRSAFIDRRHLLALGLAVAAGSCVPAAAEPSDEAIDPEHGVTAPEDLMKEHGVLERCLLVYEALDAPLRAGRGADVLLDTARLIRRFVHDYHEQNEERYVFPVLVKAGRMAGQVEVLVVQHRTGRRLTEKIVRLAQSAAPLSSSDRARLLTACRQFVRMYRPHAAREDTVVFPALRAVLSPGHVEALGERLEEEEHRMLGEGGFQKVVETVASLEKRLGIHDLDRFTPKP